MLRPAMVAFAIASEARTRKFAPLLYEGTGCDTQLMGLFVWEQCKEPRQGASDNCSPLRQMLAAALARP
jgi:hypothetical protein